MHIVGKMWNLYYDGHALAHTRLVLLFSCIYVLTRTLFITSALLCMAYSYMPVLKDIRVVLTVHLTLNTHTRWNSHSGKDNTNTD